MRTFDDEKVILDNYRFIPTSQIKFFGRFFHCWRIMKLTKSILFSKSWKNSSSKIDLPPDFHNEKHHMMMEVMRVDDCVNSINGKHIPNSFERTNKYLKKHLGNDYKKTRKDIKLYFIPDTDNPKEFNFKGYIRNFERVIMKHSEKIPQYHENYPKCKTTVFFVCDESSNYIQVTKKEDLKRECEFQPILQNFIPHCCYSDSKFIEIIKKCDADYIIWLNLYKGISVDGKKLKHPRVCIYDVKHLKEIGNKYSHELMFKVKEHR